MTNLFSPREGARKWYLYLHLDYEILRITFITYYELNYFILCKDKLNICWRRVQAWSTRRLAPSRRSNPVKCATKSSFVYILLGSEIMPQCICFTFWISECQTIAVHSGVTSVTGGFQKSSKSWFVIMPKPELLTPKWYRIKEWLKSEFIKFTEPGNWQVETLEIEPFFSLF